GCRRAGGTAALAHQLEAELEPAGGCLRLERRPNGRRRQPVDERAELQLAESLRDGSPVVASGARRLEVELHGQVDDDAADLAREERGLAVLGEPVAQLALDLVEMVVDGVERAELLEELDRGLLPHAGHGWE